MEKKMQVERESGILGMLGFGIIVALLYGVLYKGITDVWVLAGIAAQAIAVMLVITFVVLIALALVAWKMHNDL